MLADGYQHQNKIDAAIQEYENVLKDNDNNVPALNNLAWLYFQRNDPKAKALAQKANSLMPDRPEIQDTYGWILVNQDDVARGLELLRKAAGAAPNSPEIAYHLAAGLAKSGSRDEARSSLEKILKDYKEFPERGAAEALLKQLQ